MTLPSRHLRAVLTSLLVVALALLALPSVAGAQQASAPAQLRMAHFSPDTGPMDVYVAGFDGEERRVLDGLSYAQVSEYLELGDGFYTFSLRPVGADAATPAVVTETAELTTGTAYTFAALGPSDQLATDLLVDDLQPPAGGQASVRLVHATSRADTLTVGATGGPLLAEGLQFAEVSDYLEVPGRTWTLEVSGQGATETATSGTIDLAGGEVVTVVVADDPGGPGIVLVSVVDATGMDLTANAARSMPVGGVDTGGGGTAAAPADGGWWSVLGGWWALVAAVGAVVLTASAASLVSNRRPAMARPRS